jgi:hypothetical protein
MAAQEHKCSPKTKRNGAAPAHARSEVTRKRGRGNVVAEVEKLRAEVATRLRIAMAHSAVVAQRKLSPPTMKSNGDAPANNRRKVMGADGPRQRHR